MNVDLSILKECQPTKARQNQVKFHENEVLLSVFKMALGAIWVFECEFIVQVEKFSWQNEMEWVGDHRAVVGRHAETVLSETEAETTLQTPSVALQALKVKEKGIEIENNEMGGTPDAVLKRKTSEADEETKKVEEMHLREKAEKLTSLKRIKGNSARKVRNNLLAVEEKPAEMFLAS